MVHARVGFARTVAIFALLFLSFAATAADNDWQTGLSEEEELTDNFISIATGHSQTAQSAPAVTSVITAQRIKDLGARNLFDVLRTVPGFFLGRPAIGGDPAVSVRGFSSSFNQTLLVLLDGVPQTEQVFGNRFSQLGLVPLDMIERIEIMRGPGSALYGADAYSAVINIITRRAPPEKTQLTLAGGTDATRDFRLLSGGRAGAFNVVGGLEFQETNGDEPLVRADTQTVIDRLFGTRASLAPGTANTHQQRLGGHVNLTGDALGWSLRFSQSRDMGLFTGLAGALDPTGHIDTSIVESQLTWRTEGPNGSMQFGVDGAYLKYHLHDIQYFPAGAFGGLFPDGVRADTAFSEQRIRLHGKGEYTGLPHHRLSVGGGLDSAKTRLEHENRNFNVVDGQVVPIGPFQPIRASDQLGLNGIAFANDLQFAYLQDEWNFSPDWTLTWGVRYDHYSDFGDIISPRVALVWVATPTLSVKSFYGRGFRGPSLVDREARNIPSLIGNPDLRPEKLDSFEIAFDYRPRSDLTARLNLYTQKTVDQIRLQNSGGFEYRPENVGQQKGHGLELEGWWDLDPRTRLYAAYAYQDSTDETTGQDAGYTPHHLFFARLQRRQPPWFFSLQGRYVGTRDRLAEDPLPRAETYGFLDALVQYQWSRSLEVGLDVRNLLNKDAKDARFGTSFPGDTPLPGRTFYLSLTGFF